MFTPGEVCGVHWRAIRVGSHGTSMRPIFQNPAQTLGGKSHEEGVLFGTVNSPTRCECQWRAEGEKAHQGSGTSL